MVDDAIRFHRLSDPYGVFTGYARYPILVDGLVWPTSEHYFQASKFPDHPLSEQIRNAATPSAARRLGRSTDAPLRTDWGNIREQVMRRATTAKFLQHPPLALMLEATGDRPLVEDNPRDAFWGIGRDGTGCNLNGRILTDLRRELRDRTAPALPSDLTGRAHIVFGAHLIGLPVSTRRPEAAAVRSFLAALAEASRSPGPERGGYVRWDTPAGTALLRRTPSLHAPATSRALAPVLASADVTHVHWPTACALAPRAAL